MASLVFPNHLQFQNCQKTFGQGAEEYFSEIFAICLEKSTARTRFLSWNTSPSHQLAGPGCAHGPFLKMIRIASPFKKKHRPQKMCNKKIFWQKSVPQNHCSPWVSRVTSFRQRWKKAATVQLGIPAFSSWIHFQCWPSTLGQRPQMFRGGCCNPLN